MMALFLRRVCAGTILFLTSAILVAAIRNESEGLRTYCIIDGSFKALARLVILLLSTAIASLLVVSAQTKYLRYLAVYSAVNWMHLLISTYNQVRPCSWGSAGYWGSDEARFFAAMGFLSHVVCPIMSVCAVHIRIRSIASNAMRTCIMRSLNVSMGVIGFYFVILVSVKYIRPQDYALQGDLWFCQGWPLLVYLMIVLCFLCELRCIAQNAAAVGSIHQAEEARRVVVSVTWQAIGIAAGLGSTIIVVIGARFYPMFSLVGEILYNSDLLWNQALAYALSRAFTASLSTTNGDCNDSLRQKRWEISSRQYQAEPDQRWCEKVKELSGRGFTLEKLLEFYQKLGNECMRHYDPSRSTTDDVVHGAIIPLSSTRRCAMATVMMEGEYTRPQKMVTHSWRSLFRDLVAAVVADALGEREINNITHLLEKDVPLLQRWVKSQGSHSRTYWVCALSVNQHAGICGSNPYKSRDAVTFEVYAACECTLPKAFNTDPPVLANGKGIECEMNKFQDMMRFLSATDRHFQHVVAIDPDFQLFSRAWCIAEIAVAYTAGMQQHLKIYVTGDLVRQSGRMHCLKIEDMESSIPEDKAEILASIPDKAAFNKRLHDMLIGELLPAWESLDGEEVAVRIGQFVRWESISFEGKDAHITPTAFDIIGRQEDEVAERARAESSSESSKFIWSI